MTVDEEDDARPRRRAIPRLLEPRSSKALRARREHMWACENQAAIEAFNRYVERNGSIADDYRTF